MGDEIKGFNNLLKELYSQEYIDEALGYENILNWLVELDAKKKRKTKKPLQTLEEIQADIEKIDKQLNNMPF